MKLSTRIFKHNYAKSMGFIPMIWDKAQGKYVEDTTGEPWGLKYKCPKCRVMYANRMTGCMYMHKWKHEMEEKQS